METRVSLKYFENGCSYLEENTNKYEAGDKSKRETHFSSDISDNDSWPSEIFP